MPIAAQHINSGAKTAQVRFKASLTLGHHSTRLLTSLVRRCYAKDETHPMPTLLLALAEGVALSGDISRDVPALLEFHNCYKTARHCCAVAAMATHLAPRFGVGVAMAQQAGWLHDVSAIIPVTERVAYAKAWDTEILPEEQALPMILHQKLSAVIAQDLFSIREASVLSAIACHTTLKAEASLLDKVVFLADKIAWDQPGRPPYLSLLLSALDRSLDAGVCVYLGHLWRQRNTLPVLHPWLVMAYEQLCEVGCASTRRGEC